MYPEFFNKISYWESTWYQPLCWVFAHQQRGIGDSLNLVMSRLCLSLPNTTIRDTGSLTSIGQNGSIYTTEIGKVKNQVVFGFFFPCEELVVKHLPTYQLEWNSRSHTWYYYKEWHYSSFSKFQYCWHVNEEEKMGKGKMPLDDWGQNCFFFPMCSPLPS